MVKVCFGPFNFRGTQARAFPQQLLCDRDRQRCGVGRDVAGDFHRGFQNVRGGHALEYETHGFGFWALNLAPGQEQ